MPELLAPAGNLQKLKTAVHFGADAVYMGGQEYSLRAFSDNFSGEELKEGLIFLHARGKKGYVTVNIFPKNNDFENIGNYLSFLVKAGADAVILSDPGAVDFCKVNFPSLEIHLSTQANTLNKYGAKFWEKAGVKRIILARELSLNDIAEIKGYLNKDTEIEVFVHGAMCISYSGRCLLSNYLSGRDSNRGECVQACRWNYEIREVSRDGGYLTLEEDKRGSYILNSKDLNLIRHLDKLAKAGVSSFKIEGRMKSEYYAGTVVNSYKRAIDDLKNGKPFNEELYSELYKTAHRDFTEAYISGENQKTQNYQSSKAESGYEFTANVLGYERGKGLKVMQRNRFYEGDRLEVLSPGENFNKIITVEKMYGEDGERVFDAKIVQQVLYIDTDIKLEEFDILRKKKD